MRFFIVFFHFILFFILHICFYRILCLQYKIQVTMERALVIHLLSEWTLIWKTALGVLQFITTTLL